MQTMRSQRSGRVFEVLRRAQRVSPSLDMPPPSIVWGAHFAADHLQPLAWRRIKAFVGRQTASLHPSWRADSLRSPWARLEVRPQAPSFCRPAFSAQQPTRTVLVARHRDLQLPWPPTVSQTASAAWAGEQLLQQFPAENSALHKISGPAGSSASLRHRQIRLIC